MSQQLVWLVTGCSSGLGENFVRSILGRGDKVIATGRNMERIQLLKQEGAAVLQLDITDTQQNIRDIMAKAVEIYGRIDVLVNNAAYIQVGTWEDLEYEDYLAQFNTNVFGPLKTTRALLPHLRERQTGTIIFIGSRSGWIGDAGVSAYCGSKFALGGMAESLNKELTPLGIKTLLIEPGRFRTKLLTPGNLQSKTPVSSSPYGSLMTGLLAELASDDQRQRGDARRLSEIVVDVVRREGVAGEGGVADVMPFRLPLGVDMCADVRAKCEDTLRVLGEWEGVITSTDYRE